MSDICKCFAPVENAGCTILILGSMPALAGAAAVLRT